MTIDQNHDLALAGREVTDLTLAFLDEREKARPESVFPIIVYFRHAPLREREGLGPWQDPQRHREYQDRQAREYASVVQAPALEFLWHNPKVRNCFAYPAAFEFEPVHHVRSLPISNTMLVLANRGTGRGNQHDRERDRGPARHPIDEA